MRSPLRLQILEAIRAAPGIDARALSAALNTSAPRLYYHINILLQSGLIVGTERKDTQ
ncbi:MAG: winged helix-turn-helix domain-containing protein [bacterium]